eukprot:TRINITY_DN806_c0_g1_i1.p1 TRINITY_DN806_c0_g1~~TRINITY_DN806_c0_g1_i1.p1  ORF type:complete len:583 (-),score=107.49 TRINITY_DN806_c0_g1_i1:333-2006(-)
MASTTESICLEAQAAVSERSKTWQSTKRSTKRGNTSLVKLKKALRRTVQWAGLGVLAVIFVLAFVNWPTYMIEDHFSHQMIITILFLTAIILVALEDVVRMDKSAVMLMFAATMWTFHAVAFHPTVSHEGHAKLQRELEKGLADVGSIILFLLPAMGIVESIDHFHGFSIVTAVILRTTDKEKAGRLMPIVCLLSFFMSSVIDNLTATIVALKILKHVVPHNKDWRHSCGGLVVVAANARGAWSPIGDVTTTMLWIQGKVSAKGIMSWLFLPSFVAGVVPLAGIWWQARRCAETTAEDTGEESEEASSERQHEQQPAVSRKSMIALALGVLCILMVPIAKMVTGLPPYLGMLLSLGLYWLVTDTMGFEPHAMHAASELDLDDEQDELACETLAADEHHPRGTVGVPAALHKVDLSSLLFFTGVLLAVATLDNVGVLQLYAKWLKDVTGNSAVLLCSLLGISSAVVDNVPLVQASIQMFEEPTDAPIWQLVALCAGTGGSMLAVGSVAGVTLMGLEGVGFLWYTKRISLWAAVGFVLSITTYQLQRVVMTQLGVVQES